MGPAVKAIPETDLVELVQLVKQGDEAAAGQLIEATQSRLYRFMVYLCKNKEEAEECCQDTFIRALEKIDGLKNEDQFLAWLFKVGRTTFLNRKRKKREALLDDKDASQIETAFSDNDLGMQVSQVLSEMSQDDQFLLLLIDLEGLSYQEAAVSLGLTEAAVRSRLHRARKAFEALWQH